MHQRIVQQPHYVLLLLLLKFVKLVYLVKYGCLPTYTYLSIVYVKQTAKKFVFIHLLTLAKALQTLFNFKHISQIVHLD